MFRCWIGQRKCSRRPFSGLELVVSTTLLLSSAYLLNTCSKYGFALGLLIELRFSEDAISALHNSQAEIHNFNKIPHSLGS